MPLSNRQVIHLPLEKWMRLGQWLGPFAKTWGREDAAEGKWKIVIFIDDVVQRDKSIRKFIMCKMPEYFSTVFFFPANCINCVHYYYILLHTLHLIQRQINRLILFVNWFANEIFCFHFSFSLNGKWWTYHLELCNEIEWIPLNFKFMNCVCTVLYRVVAGIVYRIQILRVGATHKWW